MCLKIKIPYIQCIAIRFTQEFKNLKQNNMRKFEAEHNAVVYEQYTK